MIKIFKHIIFTFSLIIIIFSQPVQAFPFGKIPSMLKNIFKNSDEVIDVGKNLGKNSDNVIDLKQIKKIDQEAGASSASAHPIQINELGQQTSNANIYHSTKISKLQKIFKDHGIDNVDNLSDLVDLVDFKNSKESSFKNYINPAWLARVIRASDYFNKPAEEKRKVLYCGSYYSDFVFTLILEEKHKVAFLTNHISKNNSKNTIPKQKLIVIKDLDEYSIFSTQLEKNNNFPKHYFIIYKNQGFDYYNYFHGTESPDFIIMKAERGPFQNGKCFLVNENGNFVK